MEFTGERYIPGPESNDELSVEHLHRYHSILPLVQNKTVLDIACGEGYGTAILARKAAQVIGTDISDACIFHAIGKYSNTLPNLSFRQGDVANIPFDNDGFDVVVSFETIEHVEEEAQQQFLSEVKRVLRPNGFLIISTPDTENYSHRYQHQNIFHKHELTRDSFRDLLASYFSQVEVLEQGFEIVNAITPPSTAGITNLKIINWQTTPKTFRRKYLIALASDSVLPNGNMASVVLETDKDYLEQVDRIVQLQQEVESLSQWGLVLEKERNDYKSQVEKQSASIEQMMEEHKSVKATLYKVENDTAVTYELLKKIDFYTEALQPVQTLQELLKAQAVSLENYARQLQGLQDSNTALEKKQEELLNLLSEQERLLHQVQSDYTDSKAAAAQLLEQQKEEQAATAAAIGNLKNNITQKEALIEKQSEKLVKLSVDNKALIAQHASLLNELNEKNALLADLQFNFTLTSQQLSEVNNRLVTIYGSDGWKILERYYTIKGRALPENSGRYRLLKQTVNFLRGKKEETLPVNAPAPPSTVPSHNIAGASTPAPVQPLPYYQHPLVSIIIPVYNAWEVNQKCVTAILENTTSVAYEVIIADDGSTDPTREIASFFPNIVHVRNEKNLGFLLNCNHAAGYAKGKYIHFLNNDTEVRPGWLSSLVSLLERDSSIGMVGSKLIYPDGRLQEAGGIIWNDASGWNFGQGRNPEMPEFNYVKEVDYVSGASLMIRKEIWEAIGGFDRRYSPAYCEDSDLAFVLREKGYKVVYQPLSEVIHYEGYSHGSEAQKSSISNLKEYQKLNAGKFLEKWRATLAQEQFENGTNVFWARDRSRGKKTLLMVDHYVPQFDKDAGSRTTFQYLELFIKLGFNIKFLGENFYKHEPYVTVLQQMGIEVLYGPWYRDNWKQWVIENKEKFDYIYLNRPHISINFIDFFKTHTKAKILYYGHDLHFLREQKRYELEGDPALLQSAEKWKQTESYLFSKSDVVLTPSLDEQQVIRQLNGGYRVEVIRPYIYTQLRPPVTTFAARRNILFVGGFGHLPNVDAVQWFVKEVWPLLQEQDNDMQFIVVGSNPPESIKALANDRIIIKGYVSDADLENLYSMVRLTVIPLRYGAGVKGKTVEAMHYGLPIVSTAFGVEGLPGDYAFIKTAATADEFAAAVLKLYQDETALAELSKNATAYIQTNFTVAAAEKIMTGIFASIA